MKEIVENNLVEVDSTSIDSNCFTVSEFAKYLSSTYTKKSKAPFTPHEAREFAMKGRLPDKYGGQKLEYVKVKETGIKFVRIIEEVEQVEE